MRNRIMILVFTFVLLLSANVFAADLPVEVDDGNDEISINLRLSFWGDLANETFPDTNMKYKDVFMNGIKNTWNGAYQSKPVRVYITETDDFSAESIRVYINKVSRIKYPCASLLMRTVYMYDGDGRTGVTYDYTGFMQVAGHEMGHQLGLADGYDDPNANVRQFLPSPMRSPNMKASSVDYYVLLTHKPWTRKSTFRYSSDRNVLLRYLPM